MRYFSVFFIALLLTQCSTTPEKKGNVIITGEIKGLKKGTLYLQKIKDSALINIDSLVVDGDANFMFASKVTEPEIHYLYLDKQDGARYNDRIDFFAEPGNITITTSLIDFEKDVKISGGANEMKFQEYKKMLKRFNERMANDKAYKQLLKQKYLYTINFAIFNKKLEIAPYVTLTEVYDANLKYLDTVAKSLSPKIKKSRYGEQLLVYIEERKEKERIAKEKNNNSNTN